ncbi:alpha/beta hydrolase fold domain-containing protein [Streptomyces sp. NPDC050287]|uniref:alpha/beta hydrolase fold domain-containing protein n=1 Tax=Streptomyces sp. NPDC050287 TaxID=3365608 RepID=UPI003799B9E4
MSFTLDPDVAAAMSALAGDGPPPPAPVLGDWKSIRDAVATTFAALGADVPEHPEVKQRTFTATAPDGTSIALQWFALDGTDPGPAVVHAHGGGMVAGRLDLFAPYIAQYVAATQVPYLSVEYRLAPQMHGTGPAEDVYAGLAWLVEHAGELGVDPQRIAIHGESAGAGIAAGVAILARERGIALARQILIYPMLDDRTITPDPHLDPVATWPYVSNRTGWEALLGEERGTETVSPVAAPARLTDFEGLAPAYIEIGEIDIFRDESLAYARGLWHAGVSTELHVHPGLVHGFDQFAPQAPATRRAFADRVRVIASL